MNKRICDLELSDIKVGLKIRSMKDRNRIGIIERIDYKNNRCTYIKWPGDDEASEGFYKNNCECEVVVD